MVEAVAVGDEEIDGGSGQVKSLGFGSWLRSMF